MTDAEPIDLQDKAYWQARAEKAEAGNMQLQKAAMAEIARLREALEKINKCWAEDRVHRIADAALSNSGDSHE